MNPNEIPSQPNQPNPYAPQQPPYGQQEPTYGAQQPPCGPQPMPYAQKPKRHTALIIVCVIAALLFMLIVTCPDTNAHKDAVKRVLSEMVDKSVAENENTLGSAIGGFFVQQLTNFAVENNLTVDNYFICSVGSIHFAGFKRTVSFGILGHVYTFNSESAEKAINKASEGSENAGDGTEGSASSSSYDEVDSQLDAASKLLEEVGSLADSSDIHTIEDARKAGAKVNEAVQHAASTAERVSGALDKAASTIDKLIDNVENGE